MHRFWHQLVLQTVVLACAFGCSSIAPFSAFAYQQATALKVDALALMDKATEPYSQHEQAVNELTLDVEKAYEYAIGRPGNTESSQQWQIIKNADQNSLGGFLRRWKEKGVLDRAFVEEAKGLVSKGFDYVIELESGKRKPTE